MPTTVPFAAPDAGGQFFGIGTLLARASLRARLLTVIAVTALPALGVLVIAGYNMRAHILAQMVPDAHVFDAIAVTVALLLLGGTLMSLGFGVVVAEHILRRPTDALLRAADEWAEGNFAARIVINASVDSDFGRIAQTFNNMAEAVGQQHDQLAELNGHLELRVAARTHELRESHCRLIAEVAEREKAEAALRQSQKLQAVGQVAGGIAHDFNNLLTTVIGALDLLRGRLVNGQDALVRLVDSALQAAERGSKLTAQLLTFSRRQHLEPTPTDLNATITALHELLGSTLGPAVKIETDFAADIWPAQVDPSQVEAAILNVAINARDAMPEGGTLTLSTSNVTITERRNMAPGDYVAVRLTDTGIGMSEDVIALAFEPFFTTKAEGVGAGLGLSQVHGLAIQSGGDVRIRSVPGSGTTVSILLPRATADAGEQVSVPVIGYPPRNATRARILVVDDDAAVRQMAANMLNERGFIVVQADSGETALTILQADAGFDLMLTDFVMAAMNGLRLIQITSERYPALRSMLMTGHSELAAGEPISSERILTKPFNVATLEERVTRILQRPRLQVIQGGMSSTG